jgi:hypothetical protein
MTDVIVRFVVGLASVASLAVGLWLLLGSARLPRPYWQVVATERATSRQEILPRRYPEWQRAEVARVRKESLHGPRFSYSLRRGGTR